jgi:F-type H+-transporting ATPase subunit epsilon
MAAKELHVEIVAPDSNVWSGPASLVRVRTLEGEIGIMPGHTPLLAVLGEGDLIVVGAQGDRQYFHTTGGFLTVEGSDGQVIIVADNCTAIDAPSEDRVSAA